MAPFQGFIDNIPTISEGTGNKNRDTRFLADREDPEGIENVAPYNRIYRAVVKIFAKEYQINLFYNNYLH